MEPQQNGISIPYTLLIGSTLCRGLAKAFSDEVQARGGNVCFLERTSSAPASGPFLEKLSPETHLALIIWIADFSLDTSLAHRGKGYRELIEEAEALEKIAREAQSVATTANALKRVMIVRHEQSEGRFPLSEESVTRDIASEFARAVADLFGEMKGIERRELPITLVSLKTNQHFAHKHPSFWAKTVRWLLNEDAAWKGRNLYKFLPLIPSHDHEEEK